MGNHRRGSGDSVVLDPPESCSAEAESKKLPSSRFKGVVPQPNGRWGAQIYEKHQRVWLGTFNEEVEAARAYDVAAQRFRGRDAVTNCKLLSDSVDADVTELLFLNTHSKAEIVDMLRKHTYQDELQQSRRYHGSSVDRLTYGTCTGISGFRNPPSSSIQKESLFDKTVTPSDVGKLNRLVIPKQHAEKHFPLQITGDVTAACKGVLLNFEDVGGRVWRFRYSYWNSSQSYVLTKGWSRFVKEKNLKAGDVVSFQRSIHPEGQLFIDWKPRFLVGGYGGGIGSSNLCYMSFRPLQPVKPVQELRLFGVNIFKVPDAAGASDGDSDSSNGKRRREMDLFPQYHRETHH